MESNVDELVQVSKRTGRINRVKNGETPVIELFLADNESIVGVELKDWGHLWPERKTVDWTWTAYIATRLGRSL